MMRNQFKWPSFLLVIIGMLFSCTNVNVAGGASDTEVSKTVVTGSVVNSDGTPVSGAIVRLRSTSFLTDSLKNSGYTSRHSLYDTISNSDGTYEFRDVLPDSYCIEIAKDTLATLVRFSNGSDDETVQLPCDTLQSLALVDGYVKVYVTESTVCVIQVYGSEITIKPDSTGYFAIKVPQGKHSLHIGVYEPDSNHTELEGIDIGFGVTGNYKDLGSFKLQPNSEEICSDFACDSVVVRKSLDDMGLPRISVHQVSTIEDNRIVGLSLRDLPIEKLSLEIYKLSKLKVLDLGATGMKEDGSTDFGAFQSLERLFLDSNSFSTLPSGISDLTNLKALDLSDNALTTLPVEITKLTLYELLDLSGNSFCSIEDTTITQWADMYDADWKSMQICP